jgi:hypothetical protein
LVININTCKETFLEFTILILTSSTAREIGEALIDASENFDATQVAQTVVVINGTVAVTLPLDAHSSTEDYKIIATIL